MLERLKSTITVAKNHSEEVLRNMAYSSALMGAVLLSGENKSALADDVPEPAFPGDKQTQTEIPQTTPEPELDEKEKKYDSALHALRSGDVDVAQSMYGNIFREIDAYLKQQLSTRRYAQAHMIKGRTCGELATYLKDEDHCANALAIVHHLQLCDGDAQTASRTLFKKYEHELTLAFQRWFFVMNGAETNRHQSELKLYELQRSSKGFTPEEQAERERELRENIKATVDYMEVIERNMAEIAIENGSVQMEQKPLQEFSPQELQYIADQFVLGIQKGPQESGLQYAAHFGLGKVHLQQEKFETSAKDFLSAARINYFTEESFDGFIQSIQHVSPEERVLLLSNGFRQLEEEANLAMLDFHEGNTPFTVAQKIVQDLHNLTESLLSQIENTEVAAQQKGTKLLQSLQSMKQNLVTIHQVFPQSPEDTEQKSVAVEVEMP